MMKRLYAIRDQLVGFKDPFVLVNDSVAQRAFATFVNDGKSDLYENPKYYDLYFIGEFDDEKGVLKKAEPTLICSALSVKKENNVQD